MDSWLNTWVSFALVGFFFIFSIFIIIIFLILPHIQPSVMLLCTRLTESVVWKVALFMLVIHSHLYAFNLLKTFILV